MSIYIDTDVLAAYYCPEPMSGRAEQVLADCDGPTISTLTEIELFSVIAKKVRHREMRRQDAERTLVQFLTHRDGGLYTVIHLQAEHYHLARDWMATLSTPLRTLDALYLAVAVVAKLPLVTADKAFAHSATRLGTKVVHIK